MHNTVGALLRRPGVQVLMYHRIGSLDPEFSGLDLDVFRDHIRWLSANTQLIRPEQLSDPALYARTRKPAVLLTFDDGFRDFFVNAYPVLAEHEAPALVFLPTEAVQEGGTIWPEALLCRLARARKAGAFETLLNGLQPNHSVLLQDHAHAPTGALKTVSNDARLAFIDDVVTTLTTLGINTHIDRQMMTWDEIASTRPLVDYGAHTHSHPIVSRMDKDTFARDMARCCELLEQGLGARPTRFAWPNGRREDFSATALETLHGLGFEQVFTTVEGVNNEPHSTSAIRRLPTSTPDAASLNALMLRAS